jgi:hypothetical protein
MLGVFQNLLTLLVLITEYKREEMSVYHNYICIYYDKFHMATCFDLP